MADRPSLSKLAWRNIWRNRRRTLITLFGIAFGVMLAIIFTGLGDASFGQMIDYSAKMGGGHLAIQHESYEELPSLEKRVAVDATLRSEIESLPEVDHAIPRISGATMLATANNSFGAYFIAIDPQLESQETLEFLDAIGAGEGLSNEDPRGVVLGKKLAENLGLELGKKVVFTLTNADGEIVSELGRLRGVVDSGVDSIDGGLCLMTLEKARSALGYAPDEVTQLAVFVHEPRDAHAIAETLQGRLASPAVAATWDELAPELAGFIGMKRASATVMEAIIMILLAAGVFNTLFVSVMERLREFGIMSAIGFSRGQLFALVLWESFWVALVGLVAAALLTGPLYYQLHTAGIDYSKMMPAGTEVAGVAMTETILRVSIYPEHLAVICALVVLATLASGLYPAWRAGRVPPAEAVRVDS